MEKTEASRLHGDDPARLDNSNTNNLAAPIPTPYPRAVCLLSHLAHRETCAERQAEGISRNILVEMTGFQASPCAGRDIETLCLVTAVWLSTHAVDRLLVYR